MGGGNTPVKKHACQYPDCGMTFSRPSRLENHARIHTGERPFQCSDCDKSFTRKAHLVRHVNLNHNTDPVQITYFRCHACDKVFTLNHNLKKHVKRVHESRQYTCNTCPATFHKHHLLRSHLVEHLQEGKEGQGDKKRLPFQCGECGKEFQYRVYLKRHSRVHQGYECGVCQVKMERWSDLIMHRKTHDSAKPEDSPGVELPCETCSKVFKTPGSLKMHQQVHHEVREVFHCPGPYCPRYFYFLRNLRQHWASFHEGQRFACTVEKCTKHFSTKKSLAMHKSTVHSGLPPPPAKPRRPPRPRKDRGVFKKPVASVLTGLEAKNAQTLLNLESKRPLDSLEKIREEARAFVGSSVESETDSDASAVGGCRRGQNGDQASSPVPEEDEEVPDISKVIVGLLKRYDESRAYRSHSHLPEDSDGFTSDTDAEVLTSTTTVTSSSTVKDSFSQVTDSPGNQDDSNGGRLANGQEDVGKGSTKSDGVSHPVTPTNQPTRPITAEKKLDLTKFTNR